MGKLAPRWCIAPIGANHDDMQRIKLIDLPGVRELNRRYDDRERLMADELAVLNADLAQMSVQLFGISQDDTVFFHLPDWDHRQDGQGDWEKHFEFLYWEYEEEDAFWHAVGLDVRDDDGEPLALLDVFGRQLVCALRGLHPAASVRFRSDIPLTDEQIEAIAEAWGRLLTDD